MAAGARARVRVPVILCGPGSLCPSVLHMLYWRRLGSALPVARGQPFAICRGASLRPALTSVRRLPQHPPLPNPPTPPPHSLWYCTVSELNSEPKRVGTLPRMLRFVGGTCRASHYVGRGRLLGWRKFFSIFFLNIFLFFFEEEDEKSRKGATLHLAAIPGIFFWQITFCFFAVFVFLDSPPRSHCSITMNEANAAEYKFAVPRVLCLEAASPAVIARFVGQHSRL